MNSSRVIVDAPDVRETGDAPGEAIGLGDVCGEGDARPVVGAGRVGMGAGVLVGSSLPESPPHAASTTAISIRTTRVDQREVQELRNVDPCHGREYHCQ